MATTTKDLGQMDLVERVSYIASATNDKHGDYVENKSPGELEDGAIVAGGALPLFSREAFALFSQYFAIGIIYGMLPGMTYSTFQNYLHMEGYQVSAYGVLVVLGWSFKVFFGMLSDCVPIMGYRRKPWMLLGWTIATVCLAIMAFSPFPAPYCDARKITCPKKLPPYANMSETMRAAVNLDAPDAGGKFITLSVIVGFGYVMADCAADAMVVQYAQREPLAIRGRTQTAIYTLRYIGSTVAQVCIAFALNGKEYGGSFDYSVSPNVIYGILLAPCVLIVLSTFFLLVEVKTDATPFSVYVSNFWSLLQKRVMWQICAFKFINQVFAAISATPSSPMASVWANVEPLNDALSGVLAYLIMSLVMAAVGKWGLHWNWRWVIAIGTIAIIIIDGAVNFITIWDVYRNQWFYTGVPLADNIPVGIRFIVATYCAVEIADVGNEGATYGLVTTISNLASPFASVLYKYIDSYFDVSLDQMAVDDDHVRWEVTYTYFISYACKIAALGWLFMLPPQKEAMQELKKRGGSSKLAGGALVVVFFMALIFSVTTNFMSVYPSTKCYRIAGGKGTVNGSCPLPKNRALLESALWVLLPYAGLTLVFFVCWFLCESRNPSDASAPRKWCVPVPSKPVRYCSACAKNSPGLDHHCTWLNTCIGESNYEPFYILILTGTTKALYQAIFGIVVATYWLDDVLKWHPSASRDGLLAALWIHNLICIVLGLAYGALTGFHTYLLFLRMGTYDFILKYGTQNGCIRLLRCQCLSPKKHTVPPKTPKSPPTPAKKGPKVSAPPFQEPSVPTKVLEARPRPSTKVSVLQVGDDVPHSRVGRAGSIKSHDHLSVHDVQIAPTPATVADDDVPRRSLELFAHRSVVSSSPFSEPEELSGSQIHLTPLEDGALRPGGAPSYTSPAILGLLAQYVGIGLLYGALPNLLYPYFTGYFHLRGHQYNSAKTLVNLGWSLKVFVGVLSDCVPLFGYRRKSYMVLGWSATLACMVALAVMDMGPPFDVGASDAANQDVIERGGIVAILFGIATIAYVIADVPADALVVQVAQREPMATRGRMQSLIYMIRTIAAAVAAAVVGFGLNSRHFAGSYDWDMGVHTIFVLLAVCPCALMLPITVYLVDDDAPDERDSIRAYFAQCWTLVQKRVTWQTMLFNFLFNFLNAGIAPTAAPYVMLRWAGVENVNNQLVTIVGNLLFAAALAIMGKYGTMWNWHVVLVATTLGANAIDAAVQFCTIFNVLRHQWFYLGVPLAENLPYAMQFIVSSFLIVELADIGNEGVLYGLMTTVSNLPASFGPVVANAIFSHFDVDEDAIAADSPYVRYQVAWTYAIYYGTTLLACLSVALLPNQKPALHRLQMRDRSPYPWVGGGVLLFCAAALVYSIVASLLSMFDTTSCLVIAGGKGCGGARPFK
ncbi:Folate-Biopterin Transporter (FBT) Family [Achlya hypogyna]|uniref:Folate-Biopterin Transporter (FBT) Family n=1 Tax=Achlya hypogyna TaxID=1202772 RepID=A0A1V9Y9R3_ACHHY|nr:Folate-Biopterin Transporter (FBT) Family [Achlya hypogyna]